jgi:hypothetical protein
MVRRMLAGLMVFATCLGAAGTAFSQQTTEAEPPGDDATPSRLSYVEGAVSFWRPGGNDWAAAQSNIPLAAGDELFTGHDGNLEVQIGGRAFVRAWGDTQVGLANQDPNFVQLRMSAGHLALDLRSVDPGDVVEIDTPAAAFTVNQPGYYRIDVTGDRTSFVTRRSGQATITTASGPAGVVSPGEAVLIDSAPTPAVQRVAAPETDVWDRWNEARTAALLTTVSARYVPPQVYGVNELDRYGTWRADVTYGSVWVPASVAPGWVPYSTGSWIWDPHFGWTWIDTAPWGWAPYHYGRWVHLGGVWAWAPGPVVVRPVYAPALVAFFDAPGVTVGVAGPSIGWVALSWGEPLVPWWGRPGFVGRPYWGGWGGPRVTNITVHRNITVVNAVVAVRSDHFGRRAVHETRIARPDVNRLQPMRGQLAVKPDADSFTPGRGRAARPPASQVTRQVVYTRPPAQRPDPPHATDDRRDGRPDGKPEQKPAARTDVRPDAKRDARPDPRPDARREGVRDARPDAPGERRGNGTRDARPERKIETPAARVAPPAPATPPARPTPPSHAAPAAPAVPPAAPQRPPAGPGTVERPQVPRADAPRPDVRRPETPRGEPRRPEQPRELQRPDQGTDPRRPDAPGVEPRRQDAPRSEAPRSAPRPRETTSVPPPRIDARGAQVPRAEAQPPRLEPPRVDARRPEPARAETPRVESPRRTAAHGGEAGPLPAPGRVVAPERRAERAPGNPSKHPEAAPGEHARPER